MIPEGSRVLLDTVALIYFLEENERYSKTAEAIFARIAKVFGVLTNDKRLIALKLLERDLMPKKAGPESEKYIDIVFPESGPLNLLNLTHGKTLRSGSIQARTRPPNQSRNSDSTSVLIDAPGRFAWLTFPVGAPTQHTMYWMRFCNLMYMDHKGDAISVF